MELTQDQIMDVVFVATGYEAKCRHRMSELIRAGIHPENPQRSILQAQIDAAVSVRERFTDAFRVTIEPFA